jgi:hypothetical protein
VQTERENEGRKVDPKLRGWVTNVIVPALVNEWLAAHPDDIRVASSTGAMAQSDPMNPAYLMSAAQ